MPKPTLTDRIFPPQPTDVSQAQVQASMDRLAAMVPGYDHHADSIVCEEGAPIPHDNSYPAQPAQMLRGGIYFPGSDAGLTGDLEQDAAESAAPFGSPTDASTFTMTDDGPLQGEIENGLDFYAVEYRRLVTTGSYENTTIGATVLLQPYHDVEEVKDKLARWVDGALASEGAHIRTLDSLENEIATKRRRLSDLQVDLIHATAKYGRVKAWFDKMNLEMPDGMHYDPFANE